MGVFQIRNTTSGRIFVGSTLDLTSMFSRTRFQLFAGSHPNKALEADWKRLGTGKFAFEVLEEISPSDDPNYNYAADLAALEDEWLAKLEPFGDAGYNQR